ncbi:soluble quino protein glucose dehydrogenase [Auriculariales sp. MPI-PUGE-AT-0066]|nr:soluble quino protein glucose dehydrogenase [Auriculariales sp. MPI-PUGE-AT-0066]
MTLTQAIGLVALLAVNRAFAAWVTPRWTLNTASGWQAHGFASNLTTPRHLTFDNAGNLLVVESGKGVTAFKLNPDGSAASQSTLLSLTSLNTGIALSADGTTLFASSSNYTWSWTYNAATFTLSNQKVIVRGMDNADHVSRTLLRSTKYPDLLLVSRGSNDNLDYDTVNISSGRSQIRVFNWTAAPSAGYDYLDGRVLAYGVRNEVGLAEDRSGVVWGVENSADNLVRVNGGVTTDIHQDNPAEKLHKFGDALQTSNKFYGYPFCFSVWNPSLFTSETFKVGDWFSQQQSPYASYNDAWCNSNAIKPILLLKDHTAPLDSKFGPAGDNNFYVSLHGSWNRNPPTGYRVVVVPGGVDSAGTWAPSAGITSTTGYQDVLFNTAETACPGSCFRPVGLAFNPSGSMLYVTSDSTGEVFALTKSGSTSTSTTTTTTTTTTSTTSSTTSGGGGCIAPHWAQCGGKGYTGCTTCAAGYTCTYSNDWYSQCL